MSDLLIHVSRRAMACEFEVRFPAARCPRGTQLALEALDRVESLESQLSYFRPESEISRINRMAAQGPVELSEPLFDALAWAVRLSEETAGAYDITATPLWEAWGFARRAGQIPTDEQLAEAHRHVGRHLVELDPTRHTIRFREPGVRISLGSFGKGYALDVCAEHLLASGMTDFLLHGGQSSVLAHGGGADSQEGEPQHGWEIGLRDPSQSGRRLGFVRLGNRALGTSGGQFQSFRHQGRRYGHILDPRSGQPAEGVLSATVVAPTAAMADALSTAFYVMGPAPAMDYCRSRPELGALIISPDADRRTIAVHSVGLDETFRPSS